MKREYKIAHYTRENERAIFREEEWVREWMWYGERVNESNARRFWHESDCISALITLRRWWIEDTLPPKKRECEEKSEKTSWSEL